MTNLQSSGAFGLQASMSVRTHTQSIGGQRQRHGEIIKYAYGGLPTSHSNPRPVSRSQQDKEISDANRVRLCQTQGPVYSLCMFFVGGSVSEST